MILIFYKYKIDEIWQKNKTAPNLDLLYNLFRLLLRYQEPMTDFFSNIDQKPLKKSQYFQKRKCFQKEIRSKEISQKIRQKRIVGNEGPHIKSMINGLPLSWQDTVIYMMENPQYHEAITKFIIDKVYHVQLSEQANADKDSVYFLVPQNHPKTFPEVKRQIYFFSVLLEHQGMYSPNIFKRYLLILLDHARSVNAIPLMFNLFIEVLKKPELNWAPTEEIIETINCMQSVDKQKKQSIQPSEVETYFHLTTHYYFFAQKTEEIRNRIKFILEKGAECFQKVKPSLFFKLCINLSYYENSNEENSLNNSNEKETEPNVFFHEAMIKGDIVKNIFRQLFFSSKEKLKHICLDVLKNFIIEFDGMILWEEQKANPIEHFDQQIRDESNSMHLFKVFCEVFLISILQLPRNQLPTIFEYKIDTLDLILYILEKVDASQYKGKQIHQYAKQSLNFMLQQGNKEIQQTVVNTLLERRWQTVLGTQSDLIFQCEKKISFQS